MSIYRCFFGYLRILGAFSNRMVWTGAVCFINQQQIWGKWMFLFYEPKWEQSSAGTWEKVQVGSKSKDRTEDRKEEGRTSVIKTDSRKAGTQRQNVSSLMITGEVLFRPRLVPLKPQRSLLVRASRGSLEPPRSAVRSTRKSSASDRFHLSTVSSIHSIKLKR